MIGQTYSQPCSSAVLLPKVFDNSLNKGQTRKDTYICTLCDVVLLALANLQITPPHHSYYHLPCPRIYSY